jgi:hypothetical protein
VAQPRREPAPCKGGGLFFGRGLRGLGAALAAGVLTAVALCASAGATSPDRLPDLGISPIRDVLISTGPPGTKLLHFTTSIANVGTGPMEMVAVRKSRVSPWAVWQRITRSDGSQRLVKTAATMSFDGDPSHDHWHVRGLATYKLERLGKVVRRRIKRGFCLFDSSRYRPGLPGAAKTSVHSRLDCGAYGSLRATTGLSVGWQDDYYWRIEGQDIDITGLPLGKYRLVNAVDTRNWFRETNETNNVAWVDLVIGTNTVRVVGRSPRL